MVKKIRRTRIRGRSKRKMYIYTDRSGRDRRTITRLPTGMPETYTCKLKYNCQFAMNAPGAGAMAVQSFRANSLFDFDLTGAGHQPTPFDQMANFYLKYFVRSVKFVLSPMRSKDDSGTSGFVYYGMILQPASGFTAGLLYDDIMQSEKNTKAVKVFMTTGSDSSPHGMTGPCKLYYSAKKYYGKGYDDDDYKAGVGTNPQLGPILDCFACNPLGTDPSTVNFNMYAEIIATFSDPKVIGIS